MLAKTVFRPWRALVPGFLFLFMAISGAYLSWTEAGGSFPWFKFLISVGVPLIGAIYMFLHGGTDWQIVLSDEGIRVKSHLYHWNDIQAVSAVISDRAPDHEPEYDIAGDPEEVLVLVLKSGKRVVVPNRYGGPRALIRIRNAIRLALPE